jgi:putative heme iron utilization protein
MAASEGAGGRQHASGAAGGVQLPEPTHAERMRTLIGMRSVGTLCTMSAKVAGYPFGSLMPYALDAQGRPIFLISNMAMHTHNLRKDGRASVFVEQPSGDGDALGAARGTLVGDVAEVPASEIAGVRERYLGRHENAKYWVDFDDFSFWRLEPVDVYYVGGFGVMGWVAAGEYETAEADPLADVAAGIVEHMNADHASSMVLLAKTFAGIEASEAAMTSVDRLGFTVRLKTEEGMKGVRINFLREVRTAGEARGVLVEMGRGAGSESKD